MAEETQTENQGASKKKTAIMLATMLIVEAVVIVGAFFLIGSPPDVSAMSSVENIEVAEDEALIEILVLDDRLPNNKSGITYIFDTEIYIQSKKKYEDRINGE
ncbi:MAG: hypothetical protein O7G85_12555, partial [Planctomycetota bacterium]|nr:hypothetical protein [Planctomycetota bacterium]